jgi:hypothetical protein
MERSITDSAPDALSGSKKMMILREQQRIKHHAQRSVTETRCGIAVVTIDAANVTRMPAWRDFLRKFALGMKMTVESRFELTATIISVSMFAESEAMPRKT